jgi:hypothetical protein
MYVYLIAPGGKKYSFYYQQSPTTTGKPPRLYINADYVCGGEAEHVIRDYSAVGYHVLKELSRLIGL